MQVPWWLPTVFTVAGIVCGYYVHAILTKLTAASSEKNARLTLEEAEREAEVIKREAKLQARDEVIRAREDFEKEIKSRRQEQALLEERLTQRETNLDRKVAMLDKKEQAVEDKFTRAEEQKNALKSREEELTHLIQDQQNKLQEVASMSQEDAKNILMQRVEDELKLETGELIHRMQEEAKATAEEQAREIITTAIERFASDQVSEITTSTVNLPNDEMKGRIIGREGRNIRALEAATGVNILIDDTPEVVVISSFDPLRREMARLALERLMADGRIHPSRIEEVVAKVEEETAEAIMHAGEAAIYELGLQGVVPELVRTLGRLKYRHSYAQNVLRHSVEMGHIMGMMAAELGLDTEIAKRVGLFHDLGKAIDHEVEGSHAIIGADLLRKYGEEAVVYNAVAAHHREVEGGNIYSVLAAAADAISASRPGARSETTTIYLKRLEKLENISNSFRGVEKTYAMQAGRELRVIVEPKSIDDEEALQMARNIAKEIEQQLEYPGQIKVTVVRETRCIEYAR